MPKMIMLKTIDKAAMTGAMPILRIFLNEKSRPKENNRKSTPMSAHVCISCLSSIDMV